jgi:hypothetical protein
LETFLASTTFSKYSIDTGPAESPAQKMGFITQEARPAADVPIDTVENEIPFHTKIGLLARNFIL